ncbi:TetR/AcrR family transcriptional regulator [uncultured Bacteroides sp.]|uniref:TetR/AcrR family transcriptional regulator n=1 Tax=uncultured Bacteroides sp. TaxID=162156 RepID=UPI002674B89A|nr:TetR/AcrR family transcriptional regulator [uncultured Bacteroides sp.]
MKGKNITVERDREATEKRLLDTIGKMIAEEGFEKIGINAVATQSGVSKILIYRYFGSVEGLMAAYIRQHDFWLNLPLEFPDREQLPSFIKNMFQGQIEQLRNNPTLKRLYRWELSCNNDMIAQLREQREKVGVYLVEKVSELTGRPQKEIAAMASFLTASITYLAMLEDFCPVYNGIPLNEDSGWKQINEGIDILINKIFPHEH